LSIGRNGIDASTCVPSDVVTGCVHDTLITWPTILVFTSALVTTTARRANWRQSYPLFKHGNVEHISKTYIFIKHYKPVLYVQF